ncbi:MAG: hypothetical protein ACRCR9_04695 [Chitinophagaceae bacterium]
MNMILFSKEVFRLMFLALRIIFLTKEKPLECTPLESIPINLSPTFTFDTSMSLDFSTAPTVKPAIS